MAKEQKNQASEEIYQEPIKGIIPLTIAANRMAGGAQSDINPYALRNELIHRETVKRIRYKNGFTMPATAEALQADSERRVRHSRTLDRNMRKANPTATKPDLVDPHHIVAQLDPRAAEARTFLFSWGIGINDADNGVYLPRYSTSRVLSLPNASNHQGIHTTKYYLAVTQVLFAFSDEPQEAGRNALRSIRADLIAGIFPF